MKRGTTFYERFGRAPKIFSRPGPQDTRRTAQFAGTVAGRYAVGRSSSWRISNLILRRSLPAMMLNVVQREGDLHFAPHLQLLMTIWNGSRSAAMVERRVERFAVLREISRPYLRTIATVQESARRQRFIRYLMEWRMRQETEVRAPMRNSLELPARSDKPAAVTATGILRRIPTPLNVMERDSSPHEVKRGQNAEFRRVWEERAQRKAEITPTLDVNHLAERVIQAIDRKIVAQRERLGRA